MNEQQWQAVWKIYQSGSSLPPEQLRSFLGSATGDPEVRDLVLGMFHGTRAPETLDLIGQHVGHYVLTARLGEGGMGEVYAALDQDLGRPVAVKLLSSQTGSAGHPEDKIVHEAKAASALNHPNIVTIYEVIHAAPRLAIVMELVDGVPLRQLCGSPLPVDRAMHMGEQAARALAAAHARGIVHCDIKPENLMVRRDGIVKVMDFGLARDMSAVTSNSMAPAGTLRYMSPEQSRGEPPSPASDVFSLGLVLYELVSGRHPFDRVSIFESLKALNQEEPPPPSSLNPFVPARLDAVIQRMLAKDAGQRPLAMEVANLLQPRLAAEHEAMRSPDTPARMPKDERRARHFPRWLMAVIAGVALGLSAVWWWAGRPVSRPVIRFDIDLGRVVLRGRSLSAAVSPDGSRLAYLVANPAGGNLLATRLLNELKPTVLPGTEGAYEPFFSADGRWIGFFAGQNMRKISVNGGAPVTICRADTVQRGAAWGSDGFIIANLDNSHLSRVPEGGGQPVPLDAKPEDHGERTWRWPQILPGGRRVLFTGSRGSGAGGAFDEARIEVLSLDTGEVTVVLRGGYFGRYLPTGHLAYVHQGTLFAVPLDLATLKTRGNPVPVLDDVAGDTSLGSGMLDFSTALGNPGIIAYRSGQSRAPSKTLAWVNRAGKTQNITGGVDILTPSISPDAKFAAFSLDGNIVLRDLERGSEAPLTRTGQYNNSPVWMPDGKHIIFDQDGGDESVIWWIRSDGSGEPRKLFSSVNGLRLRSVSPDGRRAAFAMQDATSGWDIWMLPLDLSDPDLPNPGTPELFLGGPYDQSSPVFSPDSKWIAYMSSNSTFATEVYVRPSSGGASAASWQVSVAGGLFPVWSRDGKELFYYQPWNYIMRAGYTVDGNGFHVSKPQVWSPVPIRRTTGLYWNFEVAPNGKQIAGFPDQASNADEKESYRVTVLLNFFEELKRKVP